MREAFADMAAADLSLKAAILTRRRSWHFLGLFGKRRVRSSDTIPPVIAVSPTPGTFQVVYAAAEATPIYAINTANGAVLLSRNPGTPVPIKG
jgi:hypothetical protein